jgi:hypothetical protein
LKVKPEITNRFDFNNSSSSTSHDHHKLLLNNAIQNGKKHSRKSNFLFISDRIIYLYYLSTDRSSMTDSPSLVNSHRLKPINESLDTPTRQHGGMYGEDEEEEDEEEEDGTVQFMPPKYLPGSPSLTPTPTISLSTQKVFAK